MRCESEKPRGRRAQEASDADADGEVLYFGGVSEERREPEDTEAMQIAARINEATRGRQEHFEDCCHRIESNWTFSS